MRKTKPIDWPQIRAAYESGETVNRLAQIKNVKARAIRERAAAEGWGPNDSEAEYRAEQERKRAEQNKRLAAAGALIAMPADERRTLVQTMLVRYLQGETLYTMARELGVTRNVLYYALLGGADDEAHRDLITQALIARVALADEQLENAVGPAEVARAREMCRFYRMDLERRRPALYGHQARVEHTHLLEGLGERLRRARERTIDVQTIEALPAPEENS